MKKENRGSEAAISEVLRLSRGIPVKEMSALVDKASLAGGQLVAVDGDDDWCGNGRFKFKWPPKKLELADFLEKLVTERLEFEVLINGIPVPDEIMINAGNRLRQKIR